MVNRDKYQMAIGSSILSRTKQKKKNIKSINAENILKLSTDCMLERINQYV